MILHNSARKPANWESCKLCDAAVVDALSMGAEPDGPAGNGEVMLTLMAITWAVPGRTVAGPHLSAAH